MLFPVDHLFRKTRNKINIRVLSLATILCLPYATFAQPHMPESWRFGGIAKQWETYSNWIESSSISSCGASISEIITVNPLYIVNGFSIGVGILVSFGINFPIPNTRQYVLTATPLGNGDESKVIYYERTRHTAYCTYYYVLSDIGLYHGPYFVHEIMSHERELVPCTLARQYCEDKPSQRPICTWPKDKKGDIVSPIDVEPCRHETPLYKNGPIRNCPFPRYVMPDKLQDQEGFTTCPLYHSPLGYAVTY